MRIAFYICFSICILVFIAEVNSLGKSPFVLLSAVLAFVCFYLARQRKKTGTEQVRPKKLAKTTDKRIFSKKQLVLMWLTAIIVCFFIFLSGTMFGDQARGVHKNNNWKIYHYWRQKYPLPSPRTHYSYAINWFRLSAIPVIIGVLLVITFSKRQPVGRRGAGQE